MVVLQSPFKHETLEERTKKLQEREIALGKELEYLKAEKELQTKENELKGIQQQLHPAHKSKLEEYIKSASKLIESLKASAEESRRKYEAERAKEKATAVV